MLQNLVRTLSGKRKRIRRVHDEALEVASAMDYINSFDIRLNKDMYYAGESLGGTVLLENTENIKIKDLCDGSSPIWARQGDQLETNTSRIWTDGAPYPNGNCICIEHPRMEGIRVLLRGKVHATLKVVKSGERRTIRDDQYVLDEKTLIWGKDKSDESDCIPILPRGSHQLPFTFDLPQSALPCSLETRHGTIRYYIKVVIDIPYASSPQGIKYFSIIGPHIDCMEEKYLSPLSGQDRKVTCCWCCQRGALAFRVILDRTAYVCGENIRVKAQVENRQSSLQTISFKLTQHVEYFVDKGVLGESKSCTSIVFHQRSPSIAANSQGKYDSSLEQPLRLPVVPPTLVGVCRLIQIYYIFRVCLEDDKGNESLHLDFPLTVATVPYRIPNAAPTPVDYELCANHVEGGKYVSPEFRLGQVYDGDGPDDGTREDEIVLYRPVYVKLSDRRVGSPYNLKDYRSGSFTRIADSCQSIITENGRRRSVVINSPQTNFDKSPMNERSKFSLRVDSDEEETLISKES